MGTTSATGHMWADQFNNSAIHLPLVAASAWKREVVVLQPQSVKQQEWSRDSSSARVDQSKAGFL